MPKSYSEQRQAIFFKAARDLRKVACQVLNDCTDPAEFRGSTYEWAREHAANIMLRAAELENEGHEQCVATPLAETLLTKSKDEYSLAVDRHVRLRAEYTS
jgi:hypothetical protein